VTRDQHIHLDAMSRRDPGVSGAKARDEGRGHTTMAWLIIAILSLIAFVALTVAIGNRFEFGFDVPLLKVAHSYDSTPLIWKVISETANIPLIVIGLGFVAWLFFTKRRREALLVLLMLAAVTAGSEGVKQLVSRPRPDTGTADGIPGVVYSYPSGHVLEALTILGFVTLRLWRHVRSLAIRLAVAIAVVVDVVAVAVARMALNAHYPTDILGGLLGALGALGLYMWFTRPGAWADESGAESAAHARREESTG
jgi:undecaprenyl-diphosphatase